MRFSLNIINIEFNLLYILFISKLKILQEYIDNNLEKSFIKSLTFLADASILFIKKKQHSEIID